MQQMLNKSWAVLLATLLLFSSVFFLSGTTQTRVKAQTNQPPTTANTRTVSVFGTGTVQVEPDTAVVMLGVQTDAETASAALRQNNEDMQQVIDALRQAGIANADIRTQAVQLYPRYSQPPQPVEGQPANELDGYTATNTVEVTVRNLNNLGSLIDQAVTAGSNQVQGIRFDLTNSDEAMDDGREAAVQDATRKAQQLAGLADATLGQIISMNEGSSGPIFFQGGAAEMSVAGDVPIAPGSQTVTVNIQVTWELQP